MLTGNEIRDLFLKFFEEKHNHRIIESSSLVPDNPTVLLTTAGMLQFVPYFLGLEQPNFDPPRAVTCQKCARAGGKDSDIENVGRTPRHHTFFEMLGNFSFGDYFKKEVIPWSWEFVTEYLKLDKNRLWITIYNDDNEAFEIWKKMGIPEERILRKGKKDNFWGPPGATGPCGPCSEIHYDLGKEFKCSENCGIATCECDRWVEIWNLVFMELFQDENNNIYPLKKKNVDTGMGLERITMVVQGKTSTFETDLLKPILDEVCKMSSVEYKKSEKIDVSLRIITDHARCVTFLINDGVLPGNEGRNYVLRMIMRRALRHGKILGLELPFLHKLVDVVVKNYSKAYPDLITNTDKVKNIIRQEEEQFNKTLDRGYKILEELLAEKKDISGEDAFKLYDTFGFPLELTVEIAQESGLKVDIKGFNKEMAEQKTRAKAAAQKISLTDDLVYVDIEKEFGSTEFVGYEKNEAKATIIAKVEDVKDSSFVDIILDKTPFYAESGGQVGDSGILENDTLKVEVLCTFKVNKLFVHRCKILEGEVFMNDFVNAKIDVARREEIKIHHTNAHLLQAALIKVLGNEVKQAGSQVEEGRTRFDFSFSRAMSYYEIKRVEKIINDWIGEKLEVSTEVMDIREAQKTGAMALFGEKYEDKVRVVSIGNISKEFCGGTHVKNIGDLRLIKIVSEGAIAAGTRRIEAVAGKCAIEYLNAKEDAIDKLSTHFKTPYEEVYERVEKLQEENKSLQKELSTVQTVMAKQKFASYVEKAVNIDCGKLFVAKIDAMDANAVKEGVEYLGQKLGDSIIVVIAPKTDGSGSTIIAKVSDNFVAKGVNAGKIVSEIAAKCGGKGGGRPQFAQGGGKCEGIEEALEDFKKSV
ncbi:MAG: alanine--tRNA ligase [Candidatus Gastranaerophilales bacterium]|nr:alanine--tRNA ligase [Candidatus Gastranaerophilales bacterium]